jgi:methylated-DNA-[protein]-cysteine S-methyltransferase
VIEESASFYSVYLGQFVSVLLRGDAVQRVILGPTDVTKAGSTAAPVQALKNYLQGVNADLTVFAVDLEGCSAFERAALECVRHLHRGSVATYSEVAARIGKPQAARAVGNALSRNPAPLFIPCHRVVGASDLGGFSWGLEIKRKLLELEGARPRA